MTDQVMTRILPDSITEYDESRAAALHTAVVIHLYYPEGLKECEAYLPEIPEGIDIFLITSNEELLPACEVLATAGNGIRVIRKENRGRDVAALLVAFRPYLGDYEYLCFVHDKNSGYYDKEDVRRWGENLWTNMIGTRKYILNILQILESDEAGLLIVPPPVGPSLNVQYENLWYRNYDNTVRLANKLGLGCLPDDRESPASVGTAFWCRTKALEKLFDADWKYEDFPDEPMPVDGTISHAIERILPFVAQDAGFKTLIVMNASYAQKVNRLNNEMIGTLLDFVREYHRMYCVRDVMLTDRQIREDILPFCEKNDNIYIYGAGIMGERIISMLLIKNIRPRAVLVSDGRRITGTLFGIPVKEIGELSEEQVRQASVIVAVSERLSGEIQKTLFEKGIRRMLCPVL